MIGGERCVNISLSLILYICIVSKKIQESQVESETHVPENILNDPSNAAANAAGIENPNEVNRLKRFKQWKEEQEAKHKPVKEEHAHTTHR